MRGRGVPHSGECGYEIEIMSEMSPTAFVEEVELQGHIIDSLLLPKVLDEILTHGGAYTLKQIQIGKSQTDPSYVRIEVRADNDARLHEILDAVHDHGATRAIAQDCVTEAAD